MKREPVKPRSCYNSNGSPKRRYATRAYAKKDARKGQKPYLCDRHLAETWHLAFNLKIFVTVFCVRCRHLREMHPTDVPFLCHCVRKELEAYAAEKRA